MTTLRNAAGRHRRAMEFNPNPKRRLEIAAGWVLGAATVAMGLIAGLFYAFACAVLVGLARTDDRTLIEVMQKINKAILNPAFASSFVGAFALTASAAILQRRIGPRVALRWILAALALYFVALAVTMGANVPLNNELAKAGSPDGIADLAAVRDRFEGPWIAWNIVRAVASTIALGCLARALVLHGQERSS